MSTKDPLSEKARAYVQQQGARGGAGNTNQNQNMVESFVHHFCTNGGNGAKAARDAGYSPNSCSQQASQMLKRPEVIAKVAAFRKKTEEKALYNYGSAMEEAQRAMDFALQTDNASAFVKGVELRAKLTGLLIDRVDARVGHFQISIGGIDDPIQQIEAIDVQALMPPAEVDEEYLEEEEEDIFA